MKPNLYFVFDVESLGLHGSPFAFGFVVVDEKGNELDSGYGAYQPNFNGAPPDDAAFVAEKVIPALWGFTHTVPNEKGEWKAANEAIKQFQEAFWVKWLEWKERGALLVSDVAWPVEASFLNSCVYADLEARKWQGPYPLLDVSSILFAAGKDPVETFARKVGENPAHNPLCDARQSARVLIETLTAIHGDAK